jgi:hypothetical protein
MACNLSYLCDFAPFGRSIVPQAPEITDHYGLAPLMNDEGIEQELYISGNKVIWSSGGRLFKTLNLPSSVRQTSWCSFASEIDQCLCVLHSDGLTIYTKEGFIYPVVLPCKVRNIWALPAGMLLERDQSEYDSQSASLFSLLHPLEDVFPVAIRSGTTHDDAMDEGRPAPAPSNNPSLPVHLPKHQVLYSSPSFPLLVLYDHARSCHTFWTTEDLRPSPDRATPLPLGPAPAPPTEGLVFHPQIAIACFHVHHHEDEPMAPSASIFECSTLRQVQRGQSEDCILTEQSLLCLLRRDLLGQTTAVDAFALSFEEGRPSLSPAFSHPATAAVAVRITSTSSSSSSLNSLRGPIRSSSATHLLTLHPEDGSLRLYAGAHFLAVCSLRIPPSILPPLCSLAIYILTPTSFSSSSGRQSGAVRRR